MKIIGMLCVKNEARWIWDVLRALHFCDQILVMDDHSTDGTVFISRMFQNVIVLPSPFDDYDEPRNNTWLVAKVEELEPDWVVHVMGDEVLERDTWLKIQENLKNTKLTTIRFRVINLWDGIFKARIDGSWAQRQADSIWRFPKGKVLTYTGMHCGLPDGFEICPHPDARPAPNITLRHYGYCSSRLRRQAYDFFMERDYSARREGYKALLDEEPIAVLESLRY